MPPSIEHDFAADILAIESIPAVPTILDVVCRTTGMGFAAVARVTEDRWVACQVQDDIEFGLVPGGELKVATTICHEIRQSGTAVVINHVAEDEVYCGHPTPALYGFQSYISMPILLPDGTFFGTLCAIDPRPARLKTPEIVGMFKMFADLIGFHLDAHRRLGSAEEVRRSEAFVRGLLAASPDCVKVLSAEGRLEFMNQRGVELNQLPSLDSVLGIEFAAMWPEEERENIRSAVRRAAGGEVARIEGYCPTAKGEPRWWEASFAPFRPENSPPKIVGISRDVTERRQAEAALRDSEAALRLANADLEQKVIERTLERGRTWQLSPDLLSVIDLSTETLDRVNPAWAATLGWAAEAVEGTSYGDYVHPDDRVFTQSAFEVARRGEPVARLENRFRHHDGSYRWLSWSAVPEGDKLYARARDITEEKRLAEALSQTEEQLRQSQKMEAIGQLTGGVAHDFNNLLTVIRSSADLLRLPDLPRQRHDRYVTAIADTVDRAARLTSQLLAFARRQALRPEVLDACESVRTITDMMDTLTGSRIEIVMQLAGADSCFINADPSQFDTALVNMAVNARDAMSGEGRVTIGVRAVEAMPAIRAHPAAKGAFVAVSVSDTGSGIAPEVLEHVFEPFYTTKAAGQGTGLGLSQVYGFAKQSGGEVMVTSEVGKGTTFTLYLPRAARPAQDVVNVEPEPLVDGHGTCVLVVEDNRDIGAFATQSLSELGYSTVLALSAEEAAAELAKDADRFDVVFSDVVMPGISGIELAQRIRATHGDLPVVLTSGYSHVLAQNGTFGFELLQKPYSVEQLSRILRKVASWQRRKRILTASLGPVTRLS